MRSDNYGWAGIANTADKATIEALGITVTSEGVPTDDAGWAAWLQANKAGVDCKVTAKKIAADKVEVVMDNNGVKSTVTLPVTEGETMYLSLSGELCKLTDITVKAWETGDDSATEETTTVEVTEATTTEETTTEETTTEETTTEETTTPLNGSVDAAGPDVEVDTTTAETEAPAGTEETTTVKTEVPAETTTVETETTTEEATTVETETTTEETTTVETETTTEEVTEAPVETETTTEEVTEAPAETTTEEVTEATTGAPAETTTEETTTQQKGESAAVVAPDKVVKEEKAKETILEAIQNVVEKTVEKVVEAAIKLTSDVFESMKEAGKDVTVGVVNEKNELQYSWTFASDKLDTNKKLDIDLSIKFETAVEKQETIKELVGEVKKPFYIEFAHHGELPGEANITTYVGSEYEDNQELYLYYYNEEAKKVEVANGGNKIVVKDGYVDYTISHCSVYFLSADTPDTLNVEEETTTETPIESTTGSEEPPTGDAVNVGMFAVLVGVTTIAVVCSRKRRSL